MSESDVEWEADIRIRRNGRLVRWEKALGDSPFDALYFAHNDLELWAQDHPDSKKTDDEEPVQ